MIIKETMMPLKDGRKLASRVYEVEGVQTRLDWEEKPSGYIMLRVNGVNPVRVSDIFDTGNTPGLNDPVKPMVLDRGDFSLMAIDALGGIETGRFGAIFKAATASDIDQIVTAMVRYESAKTFVKEETLKLLGLFVSFSIGNMTNGELTAIAEAWPWDE